MKDIILKIRELQNKKKISTKDFSKEIGVTSQTIYDYYSEKSQISIKNLRKIAEFFNVSVGYFFDKNPNGMNGNSIVGNNNKQGIIISQNSEIDKLKSELSSCKELLRAKEEHLEELRQRLIDKDELIEMLKNKN